MNDRASGTSPSTDSVLRPIIETGTEQFTSIAQRFSQSDPRLAMSAKVFQIVSDCIVSLQFPPGSFVNDKELARLFNISRTPVREALQQLATRNLVTVKPGNGTYVTLISQQGVIDGQILRSSVEQRLAGLAARLLTPSDRAALEENLFRQEKLAVASYMSEFEKQDLMFRLDEEFHSLVARAAGTPGVFDSLKISSSHLDRVRRFAYPLNSHYQTIAARHRRVAERIFERDEKGAVAAMREHVGEIFGIFKVLQTLKPEYIDGVSHFSLSAYEEN